jgi:hypothetical protein
MPPPYEAPANRSNRDVIVIGASMGGPAALTTLARELPPDLPAAVLVVQHQAAESPGALNRLLDREGTLPAEMARDGGTLQRGRIYLAPPDRHLVLNERGVRVVFGPRENRSRPAIDVLFRSAAVHYRSRVTGVILSGMLDDGAAGLLAVRRCGGAAVVQAPSDSEHAEMPSRALEAVPDAEQVPLADMAAHLARRAAEAAPEPPPVPDMLWTEARLNDMRGYVQRDGQMTLFEDLPSTMHNGVTAGGHVVAGLSYEASDIVRAYVIDRGVYTEFSAPGAAITEAWDVNQSGEVVGSYYDGARYRGFLRNRSGMNDVEFPDAAWTRAFGINASGHIVGVYAKDGVVRGYIASR